MPQRDVVGKSNRPSGRVPTGDGGMRGYESGLERDYMILLRFDLNVETFEEQPVTIPYKDAEGDEHEYTPDFLVHYRRDIMPAREMRPSLVEVKPRKFLELHAEAYAPKFAEATVYAEARNMDFEIVTEEEIRTPYLDNAKFLRRYMKTPSNDGRIRMILSILDKLGEATPADLLAALAKTELERAKYLPVLYQLIALRQVGVDLTEKLAVDSPLWSLR